jgi:hypothetical protein
VLVRRWAALALAVGILGVVAPAGAAPLGATPLEPGLVGRPDIIFFESFESATWYTNWKLTAAPQNTSQASTGFVGQCLRVAVPAGAHYGTSFGFDFQKQGLAEPEELYFRYYLRFGTAWDGGSGGKLPGFGGTYGVAGWGGTPSHGDDGWSARMTFKASGSQTSIGYYVYHADMTGTYGNSWFWTGALDNDKWYCIEGYVKLDDPALSNGILRGWVDGNLVYEKTDLNFRTVSTLKVERFWFDIYYGGTWTAPVDMDLFFDNVVVASGKVGCYVTSPADAGPPDTGPAPDGPPPSTDGPPPTTDGPTLPVEGSPAADGPTDGSQATDGTSADRAAAAGDGPAGDAGGGSTALQGGHGCSCTMSRPVAPPLGLMLLVLLVWRLR